MKKVHNVKIPSNFYESFYHDKSLMERMLSLKKKSEK